MGGKIITDLVALGNKRAAVKFNNHTVSNKREYHFKRVDPYPTAQSTWIDILPQIYIVVVKVFIAYLLFRLGFYLGMVGMCIRIVTYSLINRRKQCSQRSRGPTGPGGRAAKSPGPDWTAENLPSPSAKSENGRHWRVRRARQSETLI